MSPRHVTSASAYYLTRPRSSTLSVCASIHRVCKCKYSCSNPPRCLCFGTIVSLTDTALAVAACSFGNCSLLYGKEGCRITYMATHCYSCTPASTLAYLQKLHARYGYKIWLTEFSCGDHAQGRPMPEHREFMEGVLPLLDRADYVFRYAWMSARDKSGRRGLVEDAPDGSVQLTELGHVWQG